MVDASALHYRAIRRSTIYTAAKVFATVDQRFMIATEKRSAWAFAAVNVDFQFVKRFLSVLLYTVLLRVGVSHKTEMPHVWVWRYDIYHHSSLTLVVTFVYVRPHKLLLARQICCTIAQV